MDMENRHDTLNHNNHIILDNIDQEQYNNLTWRKESIENMNNFYSQKSMDVVDDYQFDMDKLRKYSADDGMLKEPELRKKTLSIMMDRINGIFIYIKIFNFR